MRRISIRSIIAGGLVDLFASSFLGAVSVVFVLLLLRLGNTPPERDTEIVAQIVRGNAFFIAAQVVIGFGCSLMGGYLAAFLARHDEGLNGAASALFGIASSVASIALGHHPEQLALQVLLLPLKPVLGYTGGYLRLMQIRSKTASEQ